MSTVPRFPKPAAPQGEATEQTYHVPGRYPATEILDLRPPHASLESEHDEQKRDQARIRQASWAFTTRRVPLNDAHSIIRDQCAPESGDLVLARVDVIGQHRGLQLAGGRRRVMFVGDEIIVAYGNRYASSQFKSFVPTTMGPCHLVAGGGIASRAVSWHAKISRGPTHITPVGLLADVEGYPLNLRYYSLPWVDQVDKALPTTIAIVGTSMDAGKTESAAFLAKGLIRAGLRVAYIKATGTGAGGDTWLLKDAGADPVLDFTDAGLPTTYLAGEQDIARVFTTLIAHASRTRVDAILIEIADGILQRETAALLRSNEFRQLTGGIVLAAGDAMGASAGFNLLKDSPTPVLALSGLLTAAPLQVEEANESIGLPVYDREALATPENAMEVVSQAQLHLEGLHAGNSPDSGMSEQAS